MVITVSGIIGKDARRWIERRLCLHVGKIHTRLIKWAIQAEVVIIRANTGERAVLFPLFFLVVCPDWKEKRKPDNFISQRIRLLTNTMLVFLLRRTWPAVSSSEDVTWQSLGLLFLGVFISLTAQDVQGRYSSLTLWTDHKFHVQK